MGLSDIAQYTDRWRPVTGSLTPFSEGRNGLRSVRIRREMERTTTESGIQRKRRTSCTGGICSQSPSTPPGTSQGGHAVPSLRPPDRASLLAMDRPVSAASPDFGDRRFRRLATSPQPRHCGSRQFPQSFGQGSPRRGVDSESGPQRPKAAEGSRTPNASRSLHRLSKSPRPTFSPSLLPVFFLFSCVPD